MRKYEIKNKPIQLHNVLYSVTSTRYYEMSRLMILENMPDTNWNEYVLAEGSHCSCYDFDDTEWDCIVVTEEELVKILESNDCWGLRKKAKEFIKEYI